ncbi:MAG: phosphate-starvation-inducible PsiE family protein [Methanosarcinaceae archaeon]|nr:phosphate-starvation-inducible PsiE family protein [Methanosarcinaceae archaeon]
MKKEVMKNLIMLPVKLLASVIALMILIRFFYVFLSFMQNPYVEDIYFPYSAVKYILTSLILLELFILTLHFITDEVIDPNIIIIIVMTVIGRDIIVMDFSELDYKNIIAIGFLFAITIAGLYIMRLKEK